MASSKERIGVHHCSEIAGRNNWLFREQPINDIGIDAHMEFVDSSGKPKRLFALKIKSGASWFKERKDGYVVFRDINERQYNYWTMNSLPCIVVLYNPNDNVCIWQGLRHIFMDTNFNKFIFSYSLLLFLNFAYVYAIILLTESKSRQGDCLCTTLKSKHL